MPDFSLEHQHSGLVCGIDEAGRGPWAGPVVAAAVILDARHLSPILAQNLNDSKKLSSKKREALFQPIQDESQWAIGIASVEEIDQHNILQATFLAMTRAVEGLPQAADFALIDGNKIPPAFPIAAQAVVKGDSLSCSIAAASILAKVTRDRIMADLAETYPAYGWERNAGYGVKAHQEALKTHGLTPHHRRSFKPIKALLD